MLSFATFSTALMKFCDVRSSLLDIEEVIRGDKFESWRRSFVRDNVRHFSYDDENKLEYTDIHREYEEEIERAIAEGLGRGFDMADFMQSLPGYLESEEGLKDERAGLAVTLLLEVSDFEQFRLKPTLAFNSGMIYFSTIFKGP